MDPDTCYLIQMTDGEQLLEVALKAARSIEYPMEPEGKAELLAQLPAHCRSFGQVVGVREIFDVRVTEAKEEERVEAPQQDRPYERQKIEFERFSSNAPTAVPCMVCNSIRWRVFPKAFHTEVVCQVCGHRLYFETR